MSEIEDNQLNQILDEIFINMGIRTPEEYVGFFIGLNMGKGVTFTSFVNNEKLVLKHKLQNKGVKKEAIFEGLKILNGLALEIQEIGEKKVLEKYSYLK